METEITFENGSYAVRTDTGIFQGGFDSVEAAVMYANGLIDGYNAAVGRLAKATGFRANWSELRAKASNAA
jgi:hypothetical protein